MTWRRSAEAGSISLYSQSNVSIQADSEWEPIRRLSQTELHSAHPFRVPYVSVGPRLSGSEGVKSTDFPFRTHPWPYPLLLFAFDQSLTLMDIGAGNPSVGQRLIPSPSEDSSSDERNTANTIQLLWILPFSSNQWESYHTVWVRIQWNTVFALVPGTPVR